jgi:hypothetical protein
MKNFVGVRSFRKDIKPYFRFYSAPLGEIVEAEVHYRDGFNGGKRGYYLAFYVKTLNADGSVVWMPMTSPQLRVYLGDATRFNLSALQGFAVRLDASIPDLAALWLRDGSAAVTDAVVALLAAPALSLTM